MTSERFIVPGGSWYTTYNIPSHGPGSSPLSQGCGYREKCLDILRSKHVCTVDESLAAGDSSSVARGPAASAASG